MLGRFILLWYVGGIGGEKDRKGRLVRMRRRMNMMRVVGKSNDGIYCFKRFVFVIS